MNTHVYVTACIKKKLKFSPYFQMKNKNIAKVVSDCILVLADYTDRIVEQYPGLAGKNN